MEQQIPHKVGVGCEFIIPAITVLQLREPGVPEPITDVNNRSEEGIKHLRFVYVSVCEVAILIE